MDGDKARAAATGRDDGRRIALSRTQLIALTAGAALVGATVGFMIFRALAAGDEPPIRVKGGSVGAEIAQWWEPAGPNSWNLKSSGSNGSGEYYFKIVQSGGICSSTTVPTVAKTVRVDHPNERFILQHNNSKTKLITLGNAAKKSPSVVHYEGEPSNYVTKIWVHGPGAGDPWTCDFDNKGEFKEACLCVSEAQCADLCN